MESFLVSHNKKRRKPTSYTVSYSSLDSDSMSLYISVYQEFLDFALFLSFSGNCILFISFCLTTGTTSSIPCNAL